MTREITQIITAGTVSELDLLKANRPNYLGAVYLHEGRFGFAYAELSTGEFRVTEAQSASGLLDDLARISPAEVLVSERQQNEATLFLTGRDVDEQEFALTSTSTARSGNRTAPRREGANSDDRCSTGARQHA